MGAVRSRDFDRENTFNFRKPTREVPPADYADEVTEDQRAIFRFYGYQFKRKW